jgi:hypothetical protein
MVSWAHTISFFFEGVQGEKKKYLKKFKTYSGKKAGLLITKKQVFPYSNENGGGGIPKNGLAKKNPLGRPEKSRTANPEEWGEPLA